MRSDQVGEHAFAIEIVAGPGDIDELEHVSNLAYVRWVQDVAVRHSDAAGYDWSAYQELGAVFVVRRHEIDYLASAYAGDRVRASTWVKAWRGASAVRCTAIERASDGAALVRAETLWVLVHRASGRPRRIPADMVRRFDELDARSGRQSRSQV